MIDLVEQDNHDIFSCSCVRSPCKFCGLQVKTCAELDHEIVCTKGEVTCPIFGCNFKMCKNDISKHLLECTHYQHCCKLPIGDKGIYCGQPIQRGSPETHLKNHKIDLDWDEDFIQCPLAQYGCTTLFKKKDFTTHLLECEKYFLKCYERTCLGKETYVISYRGSSVFPNIDNICLASVQRNKMTDHFREKHADISADDLIAIKDRLVPCLFQSDGCDKLIPRNLMWKHFLECKFYLVTCQQKVSENEFSGWYSSSYTKMCEIKQTRAKYYNHWSKMHETTITGKVWKVCTAYKTKPICPENDKAFFDEFFPEDLLQVILWYLDCGSLTALSMVNKSFNNMTEDKKIFAKINTFRQLPKDVCPLCNVKMMFVEDHFPNCPNFYCECPLKCGETIQRNKLELHFGTVHGNTSIIERNTILDEVFQLFEKHRLYEAAAKNFT